MSKQFQNTVQFIQESFNTKEFIPLHVPSFKGNERNFLLDMMDTTFVSSVGPYVDKFEREFAQATQTKKAVAVVNGTAALQVALRLVGVKKGDEVLTQALTFVATANAIHYNNAQPVFIDVDLDTMGFSPVALKNFLEEFGEKREDGCYNKSTGKKIAACVPMHSFGFMCKIDQIVEICDTWNIPVVEDAAEALGSKYKGEYAGGFGNVAAFSFNGNKIITAGGGGAIVSNNEALATKAKYLTTTAKVPHAWEYVHDELGYNFRMPNINAALLCAQLENLNGFIENKKVLFNEYQAFFNNQNLALKPIPEDTEWNYWLMSLQLEDRTERDQFLKYTNENGVMTRPIWQLMYKLPMYAHCQKDAQKNAEFLENRIVNIPSSAR